MDVSLPDLGENIEEAEVLKVLVREGETVESDQPVLELETDKATFELPCPAAGTVKAIHVKKGDTLRIGQRLITLEAGAPAAAGRGDRRAAKTKPAGPAERPTEGQALRRERERPADEDSGESKPTDERAQPRESGPPAGEGSSESPATDARPALPREREARPRERGDGDEPGDASEARTARGAQRPRAETRDDGDATGGEDAETPAPARARQDEARPAPRPADEGRHRAGERDEDGGAGGLAAGPTARRLAREHDVDLRRIQGTGSGGRITPEDVQAFVRSQAPGGRASAPPPAADEERAGAVERQPLSGIDKAAARHLAASWSEIPHVTHHDLADVTEFEQARARHASGRTGSGPKLTWTAIVVKAVVAALKAFPRFNATLDAEREELVVSRAVHVGIAVETEHGLLVPVLRDAAGKSTRQIAAEIAALAERARARKLAREEMQGAGFTVTNLGGIGGVAFTPIVSRPEVAILGVARLHERLALREGRPVARIMLPLSLSYDHRVINGADAARFVRHIAGLLEDPVALLLES